MASPAPIPQRGIKPKISPKQVGTALELARNRHAVAQRNHRSVQPRMSEDGAVEFLNRARGGVFRSVRGAAVPEGIVGYEQAAAPKFRQGSPQRRRVLALVHVDEDQIEHTARAPEDLQGVAHSNVNPMRDACFLKTLPRALRVFGVAVAVEHFTPRPGCPREPNRRIADGRAHFENPLCAGNADQKRQQPRYRWSDDGHAVLCCVGFHFAQHSVTLREKPVDVLLDVLPDKRAREVSAPCHVFGYASYAVRTDAINAASGALCCNHLRRSSAPSKAASSGNKPTREPPAHRSDARSLCASRKETRGAASGNTPRADRGP